MVTSSYSPGHCNPPADGSHSAFHLVHPEHSNVEMSRHGWSICTVSKMSPSRQFQASRAVGLKYVMNVTCYDFDEAKQRMFWEHLNEVNNNIAEDWQRSCRCGKHPFWQGKQLKRAMKGEQVGATIDKGIKFYKHVEIP